MPSFKSKYKKRLRVLAFGLLASLGAQDVVWAAPDAAQAVRIAVASAAARPGSDFGLPETVASVERVHQAAVPTVFLIRDAHTNPSAQKNLALTLEHLINRESLGLVLTEGGSGDLSLSFLKKFGTAAERERTAAAFLRRGEINGAEYLQIASDREFALEGVEDGALYESAVAAYREVAARRPEIARQLAEMRITANFLKPRILSKDLAFWLERRERFERGEVPLAEYWSSLAAEAAARRITDADYRQLARLRRVVRMEAGIDFARAGEELDRAVAGWSGEDREEARRIFGTDETLGKPSGESAARMAARGLWLRTRLEGLDGVSNLRKYCHYLNSLNKLQPEKLMAQAAELEERILDRLAGTADERGLVQAVDAIRFYQALYDFKLIPRDLDRRQKNLQAYDIEQVLGFLNREVMEAGGHAERALFLSPDERAAYPKAVAFYELAQKRDEAFVRNLLEKISSGRAAPVSGGPNIAVDSGRTPTSKVALITGGFHTPHLESLLERAGLSYAVITPHVYEETDQARYEKILFRPGPPFESAGSVDPSAASALTEPVVPAKPITLTSTLMPRAARLSPDTLLALGARLGAPEADVRTAMAGVSNRPLQVQAARLSVVDSIWNVLNGGWTMEIFLIEVGRRVQEFRQMDHTDVFIEYINQARKRRNAKIERALDVMGILIYQARWPIGPQSLMQFMNVTQGTELQSDPLKSIRLIDLIFRVYEEALDHGNHVRAEQFIREPGLMDQIEREIADIKKIQDLPDDLHDELNRLADRIRKICQRIADGTDHPAQALSGSLPAPGRPSLPRMSRSLHVIPEWPHLPASDWAAWRQELKRVLKTAASNPNSTHDLRIEVPRNPYYSGVLDQLAYLGFVRSPLRSVEEGRTTWKLPSEGPSRSLMMHRLLVALPGQADEFQIRNILWKTQEEYDAPVFWPEDRMRLLSAEDLSLMLDRPLDVLGIPSGTSANLRAAGVRTVRDAYLLSDAKLANVPGMSGQNLTILRLKLDYLSRRIRLLNELSFAALVESAVDDAAVGGGLSTKLIDRLIDSGLGTVGRLAGATPQELTKLGIRKPQIEEIGRYLTGLGFEHPRNQSDKRRASDIPVTLLNLPITGQIVLFGKGIQTAGDLAAFSIEDLNRMGVMKAVLPFEIQAALWPLGLRLKASTAPTADTLSDSPVGPAVLMSLAASTPYDSSPERTTEIGRMLRTGEECFYLTRYLVEQIVGVSIEIPSITEFAHQAVALAVPRMDRYLTGELRRHPNSMSDIRTEVREAMAVWVSEQLTGLDSDLLHQIWIKIRDILNDPQPGQDEALYLPPEAMRLKLGALIEGLEQMVGQIRGLHRQRQEGVGGLVVRPAETDFYTDLSYGEWPERMDQIGDLVDLLPFSWREILKLAMGYYGKPLTNAQIAPIFFRGIDQRSGQQMVSTARQGALNRLRAWMQSPPRLDRLGARLSARTVMTYAEEDELLEWVDTNFPDKQSISVLKRILQGQRFAESFTSSGLANWRTVLRKLRYHLTLGKLDRFGDPEEVLEQLKRLLSETPLERALRRMPVEDTIVALDLDGRREELVGELRDLFLQLNPEQDAAEVTTVLETHFTDLFPELSTGRRGERRVSRDSDAVAAVRRIAKKIEEKRSARRTKVAARLLRDAFYRRVERDLKSGSGSALAALDAEIARSAADPEWESVVRQVRDYFEEGLLFTPRGYRETAASDQIEPLTLAQRLIIWEMKRHLEGEEAGVLNASQARTGKTITSVLAAYNIQKNGSHAVRRVLYTTTKSALYEVRREIERRTGPDLNLRIFVADGRTPAEREAVIRQAITAEGNVVLIANYDAERLQPELFEEFNPQAHIVDEIETLRNRKTDRARAVFAVPAEYRIGVSARLVVNQAGDVIEPLAWLRHRKYAANADAAPDSRAWLRGISNEALFEELDAVMVRWKRRIVFEGVPNPVIETVRVPLSGLQEAQIRRMRTDFPGWLEEAARADKADTARHIFRVFELERRASLDLRLVLKPERAEGLGDEGLGDEVLAPKLLELDRIVESEHLKNGKTVVLVDFVEAAESVAARYNERYGPGSAVAVHSGLTGAERDRAILQFRGLERPLVLIGTTALLGSSLNLFQLPGSRFHISTLVRLSKPWTNVDAPDRLTGPGQTHTPREITLVSHSDRLVTIEHRLEELLARKAGVFSLVVDGEPLIDAEAAGRLLDFARGSEAPTKPFASAARLANRADQDGLRLSLIGKGDASQRSGRRTISRPEKSRHSASILPNERSKASESFWGIRSQTTEKTSFRASPQKSKSLVTRTRRSLRDKEASRPSPEDLGADLQPTLRERRNEASSVRTFSSSRNSGSSGMHVDDRDVAAGDRAGVFQSGFDVTGSERREGLADAGSGAAVGEHFQNLPDHNPGALESGLAVADARIRDDVRADVDLGHGEVPREKYNTTPDVDERFGQGARLADEADPEAPDDGAVRVRRTTIEGRPVEIQSAAKMFDGKIFMLTWTHPDPASLEYTDPEPTQAPMATIRLWEKGSEMDPAAETARRVLAPDRFKDRAAFEREAPAVVDRMIAKYRSTGRWFESIDQSGPSIIQHSVDHTANPIVRILTAWTLRMVRPDLARFGEAERSLLMRDIAALTHDLYRKAGLIWFARDFSGYIRFTRRQIEMSRELRVRIHPVITFFYAKFTLAPFQSEKDIDQAAEDLREFLTKLMTDGIDPGDYWFRKVYKKIIKPAQNLADLRFRLEIIAGEAVRDGLGTLETRREFERRLTDRFGNQPSAARLAEAVTLVKDQELALEHPDYPGAPIVIKYWGPDQIHHRAQISATARRDIPIGLDGEGPIDAVTRRVEIAPGEKRLFIGPEGRRSRIMIRVGGSLGRSAIQVVLYADGGSAEPALTILNKPSTAPSARGGSKARSAEARTEPGGWRTPYTVYEMPEGVVFATTEGKIYRRLKTRRSRDGGFQHNYDDLRFVEADGGVTASVKPGSFAFFTKLKPIDPVTAAQTIFLFDGSTSDQPSAGSNGTVRRDSSGWVFRMPTGYAIATGSDDPDAASNPMTLKQAWSEKVLSRNYRAAARGIQLRLSRGARIVRVVPMPNTIQLTVQGSQLPSFAARLAAAEGPESGGGGRSGLPRLTAAGLAAAWESVLEDAAGLRPGRIAPLLYEMGLDAVAKRAAHGIHDRVERAEALMRIAELERPDDPVTAFQTLNEAHDALSSDSKQPGRLTRYNHRRFQIRMSMWRLALDWSPGSSTAKIWMDELWNEAWSHNRKEGVKGLLASILAEAIGHRVRGVRDRQEEFIFNELWQEPGQWDEPLDELIMALVGRGKSHVAARLISRLNDSKRSGPHIRRLAALQLAEDIRVRWAGLTKAEIDASINRGFERHRLRAAERDLVYQGLAESAVKAWNGDRPLMKEWADEWLGAIRASSVGARVKTLTLMARAVIAKDPRTALDYVREAERLLGRLAPAARNEAAVELVKLRSEYARRVGIGFENALTASRQLPVSDRIRLEARADVLHERVRSIAQVYRSIRPRTVFKRLTHQLPEQGDPIEYAHHLKSGALASAAARLANKPHAQHRETVHRLIAEFEKVLEVHTTLTWPPALVVFGSARIPKKHLFYRMAEELGAAIADRGWAARTGAGLSIMEGVLKGLHRRRDILREQIWILAQGIRIYLDFEQETNPYVAFPAMFEFFLTRKLGLHENSLGAVSFPGGIGTLDESFEVWRRGHPLIFYGKSFWRPILRVLERSWKEAGVIDQVYGRGAPPRYVDDVEEALDLIDGINGGINIREPKIYDPSKLKAAMSQVRPVMDAMDRMERAVVFVGRPNPQSPALDVVGRIADQMTDLRVSVRAASRGPILETLIGRFEEGNRADRLQSAIFVPNGSKLDANERGLLDKGRLVSVGDESLHQFVTANNAYGYVFTEGGVGTMNRLFDIVQLIQTDKMTPKPVILIGNQFWGPILEVLKKQMLPKDRRMPRTISPNDLKIFTVVDDADEAVRILNQAIADRHAASHRPAVRGARLAVRAAERVYDAAVVGAGPAGLMAGAALRALGMSVAIFEKGRVGASWEKIPEPFILNFRPSDFWGSEDARQSRSYRTRAEVVGFFRRYVRRFGLEGSILDQSRVAQILRAGLTGRPLYQVLYQRVEDEIHRLLNARSVVVATGIFQNPRVLDVQGVTEHADKIVQANRDPKTAIGDLAGYKGKNIIIVGGGNTALRVAQLLKDSNAQSVTLIFSQPEILWSDQTRNPVHADPRKYRSMVTRWQKREPGNGKPTLRLMGSRRIQAFTHDRIQLIDNQSLEPREALLYDKCFTCIGFRPDIDFLRAQGVGVQSGKVMMNPTTFEAMAQDTPDADPRPMRGFYLLGIDPMTLGGASIVGGQIASQAAVIAAQIYASKKRRSGQIVASASGARLAGEEDDLGAFRQMLENLWANQVKAGFVDSARLDAVKKRRRVGPFVVQEVLLAGKSKGVSFVSSGHFVVDAARILRQYGWRNGPLYLWRYLQRRWLMPRVPSSDRLAVQNMPPHQKAIPVRMERNWVLATNPFPTMNPHFVMAAAKAEPQALDLPTLKDMVTVSGLTPWTVFFNAVGGGASIYDHLHFQICNTGDTGLPIEDTARFPLVPVRSFGPAAELFEVANYPSPTSSKSVLAMIGSDPDGLARWAHAVYRLLTVEGKPVSVTVGRLADGRIRINFVGVENEFVFDPDNRVRRAGTPQAVGLLLAVEQDAAKLTQAVHAIDKIYYLMRGLAPEAEAIRRNDGAVAIQESGAARLAETTNAVEPFLAGVAREGQELGRTSPERVRKNNPRPEFQSTVERARAFWNARISASAYGGWMRIRTTVARLGSSAQRWTKSLSNEIRMRLSEPARIRTAESGDETSAFTISWPAWAKKAVSLAGIFSSARNRMAPEGISDPDGRGRNSRSSQIGSRSGAPLLHESPSAGGSNQARRLSLASHRSPEVQGSDRSGSASPESTPSHGKSPDSRSKVHYRSSAVSSRPQVSHDGSLIGSSGPDLFLRTDSVDSKIGAWLAETTNTVGPFLAGVALEKSAAVGKLGVAELPVRSLSTKWTDVDVFQLRLREGGEASWKLRGEGESGWRGLTKTRSSGRLLHAAGDARNDESGIIAHNDGRWDWEAVLEKDLEAARTMLARVKSDQNYQPVMVELDLAAILEKIDAQDRAAFGVKFGRVLDAIHASGLASFRFVGEGDKTLNLKTYPENGGSTVRLWDLGSFERMKESVEAPAGINLPFEQNPNTCFPILSTVAFAALMGNAPRLADGSFGNAPELVASLSLLTGRDFSPTELNRLRLLASFDLSAGPEAYRPLAVQPVTLAGYLQLRVYLEHLSRETASISA